MPHGHRDDDEALFADLAEALARATPMPDTVAEQARGAFAWRTIDSDLLLATIVSDSLEHAGGTGIRDADGTSRVLVFTADPLTLELEVMSDRVLGQIVPPTSGEIVVESADGGAQRFETDERGFFILDRLPAGSVRLRCDTPTAGLVTEWFPL